MVRALLTRAAAALRHWVWRQRWGSVLPEGTEWGLLVRERPGVYEVVLVHLPTGRRYGAWSKQSPEHALVAFLTSHGIPGIGDGTVLRFSRRRAR